MATLIILYLPVLFISFPDSLDNQSNDIRWSLDLRWYKHGDPTGFFGVKDGIRMRDSKSGEKYEIPPEDWNRFNNVNRHVEIPGIVEKEKVRFVA